MTTEPRRAARAACLGLAVALASGGQRLMAQGRSIPVNEEVRAQQPTEETPLPEGQKYRYPLVNGLMVSVNVFDPILKAITLDHANYEASVMLDLHHRFMPMATVGLGSGDDTTDDGVRYHVKATPYVKAGLAYNTKFNQQVRPGDWYGVFVRYGCSKSTADITGLTYTDGYWRDYGPENLFDQEFRCHWLEVGGLVRVQVVRHVSLGWDLYWRPMFRKGGSRNGDPYFVPGYGVTPVKFGFNFDVVYHIF